MVASSPLRVLTPVVIVRLLLNQSMEVEIFVVLIRLGTRIAEYPLLVQLFGDLIISTVLVRDVLKRKGKRTSSIFFGVICKSLEPDCCSSTVVSGKGFLRGQL